MLIARVHSFDTKPLYTSHLFDTCRHGFVFHVVLYERCSLFLGGAQDRLSEPENNFSDSPVFIQVVIFMIWIGCLARTG